MINTKWEMKREEEITVCRVGDINDLGVTHSTNIYHELNRANIAKIVKLASYFPKFNEEDMNEDLMVEVSKKELQALVESFQTDKNPEVDGWSINFFLWFNNFIKDDSLKGVEESRASGRILGSIDSIFVPLIHKKDDPSSFKKFKQISLYNSLYKIISKVIGRM
jgi:hypothetical protein